MNNFDPALPVQTRGGLKAVIIATDVPEGIPGRTTGGPEYRCMGQNILAAITDAEGEVTHRWYHPNGAYYGRKTSRSQFDLVNVEPTFVDYVNLGDGYSSFAAAQASAPGWSVIKVTREGDSVTAELVTE